MNQLTERVSRLEEIVTAGFERTNLAIANLQVVANQEAKPSYPKENAPKKEKDPGYSYYVSREKVNALVIVSEDDLEKFVLGLEMEVFKDPWDMKTFVDHRCDQPRVHFIRECVFKHYEVPQHLRKFVWEALKECLNRRVAERTANA